MNNYQPKIYIEVSGGVVVGCYTADGKAYEDYDVLDHDDAEYDELSRLEIEKFMKKVKKANKEAI